MKKKIIETKVDIYTFDELDIKYKKLIDQAKDQVEKAYAPYSGFHVGAAVLLANGEIFAGSNQENAAYPSGLCAERVAMFFANAQYPDVPVEALAVVAFTGGSFVEEPVTPCGSCRQVLLEAENRFERNIAVFMYGNREIYQLESAKQLLPLCFEKNSLKR